MRIISTWRGKALPLTGGTLTGDLTMSGANILLGANKLKTTTCLIKEIASDYLGVRNLADDAFKNLKVSLLNFVSTLATDTDGAILSGGNTDNYSVILKVRDSGNALVEIARLQGAADPYLQMTLPMVLTPAAIPGALVEGHFAYVADEDKLAFYDGVAAQFIASNLIGMFGMLRYSLPSIAQNLTRYLYADAEDATAPSTETPATMIIVPVAGTLKNLYIKVTTAPVAGQTFTFTVRVNGVDTELVVVIENPDTTGSDVAHEAAVAVGDYVTISVVTSVTSGACVGAASLALS